MSIIIKLSDDVTQYYKNITSLKAQMWEYKEIYNYEQYKNAHELQKKNLKA